MVVYRCGLLFHIDATGGGMPEQRGRFFTIDEALNAVGVALARYPSQLNLISVIWPMVFGDEAYVLTNGPNRAAWAKLPGRSKLLASSETDLKQRIMEKLKRRSPSPARLARICAQVFGAQASSGPGPDAASSAGIWIHTDMDDFVCIRCGHCCRMLNYRDGCTLADYQRWQDLGRADILEWVGTISQNGRVTACRIWMLPGTNRYAGSCPWLKPLPEPERYVCTIYDVRPMTCRQYPGSRKHARMTGCRGV